MDGLIWGAQDGFIIVSGALVKAVRRLSSSRVVDQRINM